MPNLPAHLLATQAVTLQWQSGVCANNIANGKTTGFRGDHATVVAFNTHLAGGETISYPVGGGITSNLSQGSLRNTGNPYNVAISGPGFFMLEGGVFARDGVLLQNPEGVLINDQHIPFLDTGGNPITVPAGAVISISREGMIATPEGIIAQLGVAAFPDEDSIQKRGDDLYVTKQEATPLENPMILQGYLEQSNVQIVKETVDFTNNTTTYQETMHMTDQFYKLSDDLVSKLLKV